MNAELDMTLCVKCHKKRSMRSNPRSVMPLGHAVETAEAILIKRLDDLYLQWVEQSAPKFNLTNSDLIQLLQELQLTFFPSAFDDGEKYEPNAGERMNVPPLSLFARRPAESPVVRLIVESERAKAVGRLRMTDGKVVLTDSDLARLAERRERRGERHAAGVAV